MPKGWRLAELVERFGGRAIGEADIMQVAPIERAGSAELTFVTHPRYRKELEHTKAAAVILNEALQDATVLPRIVCANPAAYFAHVAALFNPEPAARPGIDPSAVLHPTAMVAASAQVGAHVYIGADVTVGEHAVIEAGCVIGDRAVLGAGIRLYPNVTVYHGCHIGARAILHSGVVIGADGFGLALEDGRWLKIPQIGRVVIGADVEIGANTTVDRGAMDDTVIGEGVKLDNQIQIGHNVRIGAHTAIAACTGIAGSTTIGRQCQIGGAVRIIGHLNIADRTEISAACVITKSIDVAGVYAGFYPFEAHRDWLKNAAHLRHLNELVKRIRELESRVDHLQGGQK
ncbi:MAG: UDP-3-O-(3-hydroxymyristoyl)glucosamine N-acyltransferase [Burkholderiales bacterium]|nr:UDP-3-O-(3-hydroxymyristoyl)glucosamine N-acyltransferase [Burkholderiales bacterium]MDQ3196013.1 UDP-3-O-(3-hydroxymyristoyl)glucosamine N-acyltransferase [Pseudomonadota bacterium]